MISPLEIYLVLQMDSIKEATQVSAVVSGAGVLGSLFIGGLVASVDSWDDVTKRESKAVLGTVAYKWTKRLALVCSLSAALVALLPSTKTLAAMLIIPAVMNSETVQKEAGELYTMAKTALEEAVKPEESK